MNNVTIDHLNNKKTNGQKITMLTAYDFSTAKLLDDCGVDILLVGDSLGMVALGYETTLPVSLDEMLHHTRAVTRGTKRAFVVGDMPFMSYQTSVDEAVANAGRFLKEAGANGVKIEGGEAVFGKVKAMVAAGIPVMGHLGITPQSVNLQSGYKIQGRTDRQAQRIIDDALGLQEAGAFAVVLECIPGRLAEKITESLDVPTIGIGAGGVCSGQVLVTDDLLGKCENAPKFAKKYMDFNKLAREAINSFVDDVANGSFPGEGTGL